MMANAEELTVRGFTIDLPTSLPEEPTRSFGGAPRCTSCCLPLPWLTDM